MPSGAILNWRAVPNADSYAVYFCDVNGNTTGYITSTANTYAIVSGLTPGVVTRFFVMASNAGGAGKHSNVASVVPGAALSLANSPPAPYDRSAATDEAGDDPVDLARGTDAYDTCSSPEPSSAYG